MLSERFVNSTYC